MSFRDANGRLDDGRNWQLLMRPHTGMYATKPEIHGRLPVNLDRVPGSVSSARIMVTTANDFGGRNGIC